MSTTPNLPSSAQIEDSLDRLAMVDGVEANCMFQLALMLARIAIEPCSAGYKEEAAQVLMGLMRAKPKSNVVRLFGDRPVVDPGRTTVRATG